MITSIFWIIWIVNVLMVLIRRKSRILSLLTFALMVTIAFLNTGSGDYETYYVAYTESMYNGFEMGYIVLMNIAKYFALSFNQFQGIIYTISLLVILYVFKQYSNNYHVFFSLYFIYQFFYDIDTLRNFIARSILLLAFYWLINGNKLKYIITIFIGFLIHRMLILYLPIVFFNPRKKVYKRLVKHGAIIVILLCIIAFVSGYRYEIVAKIGLRIFTNSSFGDRILALLSVTTRYGFIIYFIIHMGNIFLIRTEEKYVINRNGINKVNLLYKYCWFINIYVIIFFPLIMINVVAFRLFNNIIMLNFILYTCALDTYKTTTTDYYKNYISIFILNLLYRLPFVHSSSEMFHILDALM